MESLPAATDCPASRVIPLPVALYDSNGLLFGLYDGGQRYQPMVIRWERLKPIIRKNDINTDEEEWSRKVLQAALTVFIPIKDQAPEPDDRSAPPDH